MSHVKRQQQKETEKYGEKKNNDLRKRFGVLIPTSSNILDCILVNISNTNPHLTSFNPPRFENKTAKCHQQIPTHKGSKKERRATKQSAVSNGSHTICNPHQ